MPQCVLCEYKKSSQANLMFDCDGWFACSLCRMQMCSCTWVPRYLRDELQVGKMFQEKRAYEEGVDPVGTLFHAHMEP